MLKRRILFLTALASVSCAAFQCIAADPIPGVGTAPRKIRAVRHVRRGAAGAGRIAAVPCPAKTGDGRLQSGPLA